MLASRASRLLFVAASLAAAPGLASPGWAAPVPTPVTDITDPRSLASPVNPAAAPVPLADLEAIRIASEAVWTPDGQNIVITANLTGRFNLWKLTRGEMMPLQLTQSDDRQHMITVSRDGKAVYFASDRGGNEVYDLFSVPIDGGAPTNLTRSADVSETGLILAADGRSGIVQLRRADQSATDIGVIDLASGVLRNLTGETNPRLQWTPIAYTADGRSILAARGTADYTTSAAFLIDLASGRQTRIITTRDSDFVAPVAASPDGAWIAFNTTMGTGRTHAGLYHTASGATRMLPDTPFERSAVAFTPDSRSLIISDNADGRATMSFADVATFRVTPLHIAPGYVGLASAQQSSFNPQTGALLVNRDAGDSPMEYWEVDPAGKTPARQVTRLAIASLDPARLPRNEIVHYRSFDGTPISALVTMPFNLRRDGSNPLVVMPHGGPPSQSQDYFVKMVTALSSRGYIVFQPNYRGSTGYGDPFMKANDFDFGGGDVKDIVAGVEFLKSTGFVDPARVAITGGSYGGFLTLMCLGKHPDMFRAGVDLYGVINWYTMVENKEGGLHEYLLSKLGDPVRNKALYDAASPMTYARNIRAPLLILQGENDARVPRAQAVQAAELIRKNGGVVDLVFYPQEGHVFSKRENAADSLKRLVEWLDRYVKDQP